MTNKEIERMIETHNRLVKEAVAAEREACALVALQATVDHKCDVDVQIARAIRARNT